MDRAFGGQARGVTAADSMKAYENIVTFEAMVVGYIDAAGRFNRATGRGQGTLAYVALSEALNWAVSLEDRTRRDWAPDGEPVGWEWRERLPNTEVMAGVRFARNRVHHQWADAMVIEQRTYPYKFPLLVPEWKWRPANDLPPGDQKHPDPDGEAAYRRFLEGRQVSVALDDLSGVFYTLQMLLEPASVQQLYGHASGADR